MTKPTTKKQRGEAPVVDLRKCKKGDQLRLRDGSTATYVGPFDSVKYPHAVRYQSGYDGTRTDSGRTWADSEHVYDVVEIVATPKPAKAKAEGRVWKCWAVVDGDAMLYLDGTMTRQEARNLRSDDDRLIASGMFEMRDGQLRYKGKTP